jgi:hypothetical protein
MLGSAEDLLAGLDRILPGVNLELEEDVLHGGRLCPCQDQDVDRLILGHDFLEADSGASRTTAPRPVRECLAA